MDIELTYQFYREKNFTNIVPDITHKTINELDSLQKNLLKEFFNQILLDDNIWGRNKNSADSKYLKVHQQVLNFQVFEEGFKHYHLVASNQRNDLSLGDITAHTENQNTCDTLVHYQLCLKNNKIIVYSISSHNKGWKGLHQLNRPKIETSSQCQDCSRYYLNNITICPYCYSINKNICVRVDTRPTEIKVIIENKPEIGTHPTTGETIILLARVKETSQSRFKITNITELNSIFDEIE